MTVISHKNKWLRCQNSQLFQGNDKLIIMLKYTATLLLYKPIMHKIQDVLRYSQMLCCFHSDVAEQFQWNNDIFQQFNSIIYIHMGGKKKHHQKKQRNSDQQQRPIEQPAQKEEQAEQPHEEKFEPILPKKVSYCPVCSFPFELCKYGKQAPQCAAFLYKLAPTKVTKYHPDFKPEQLQQLKQKKQATKSEENTEGQVAKDPKDPKTKSLKDKYIVIEVKNRGKKNFITTVSGMNNFNVDAKQVAKKCSKKFAVSCSAIELGTAQLQGDNGESMREFLLAQYKQLKKKYIIDKEQFNEKQAEQKAKRKQARKLQQGAIQQQPQQEQKPVQVIKDKNTLRMEMMQKAQDQNDDD